MNRQQRRAAQKRVIKSMSTNGTSGTMHEMPRPLEQLERPEVAASLSVPETNEVKERDRLIERQTQVVVDAQKALDDASKMLTLLRSEKRMYLIDLLRFKQVSEADDYRVDAESGFIFRVARAIPAAAPADDTDEAPVSIAEVIEDTLPLSEV